jgi:outer membrane biosynthesis protein TonB
MQRSEAIGLGVALVGHAILFGLLSVGFLATPNPEKLKQAPIDVSLVDEVGLVAKAPQAITPPAESRAPDQGPPEDAAPPAARQEAQPDPVPPAPQPKAAPPPKPAPNAVPQPKKPVAPTPDKSKKPPTRDAAPTGKKAGSVAGTGSDPNSDKKRARGSRLGDDFLKGLSDKPSQSKSVVAQAPVMSQQAAADIGSAIKRQVQPCADRQVKPGPGAERIIVTIRLRMNRDGSLIGNPAITDHSGIDDENRRYTDRVDDNAVATFKGCSPLRGLPAELYDVPNGWSVFSLRYKLPG